MQKQSTGPIMTAWDEMLVAKACPGKFNASYVAGMNVTNLPTNTFAISNTFATSGVVGSADDHRLGTSPYTLLMWSPAMTAFRGSGSSIPTTDKLGGLVIK